MRTRDKLVLIVAVVIGLAALSAGIAVAAAGGDEPNTTVVSEQSGDEMNEADEADDGEGGEGGDDSDESLTGEAAAKASDAALAATGGGTVLAVERDDANAGYEVEIRKTDGSEAEVELDGNFDVVQRTGDD